MANTANIVTLSIAEIDALYPTPNSTLTTDLSIAPYYDDYDKKKNYYRILYRPGYAVQSRELNQTQTILQKQISRFGQHVFKEGSIVLPGEFAIELDVDYIKINDTDPLSKTVITKNFLNTTLVSNTGIKAYVIDYAELDTLNDYPKTLYIRYTSGSTANANLKTFAPNEILSSPQGQVVVKSETDSVGKGSRFIIREGVFYAKEHFIWFPTQSIILERYTTTPNVRVGFQIQESLIRYTEDTSLLDPALEASNYSAPGADRLKLDPILTTKSYDNTEGPPDFVELFTVREGVITELYNRPQYNILQDELAKRTLDESGDYYVRGLDVRIREHLDINNNGGYLKIEDGGDANSLAVGVEPGLAYVKGYERQLYTTQYVKVDKSMNFSNVSSQASTTTMGNYIVCDEVMGYIVHDQGNLIYLIDKQANRISDTNASAVVIGSAPVDASIIGTARVRHIEWYDSQLGSPDGQVSVYLTDIRMVGSNVFSSVKGVYSATFGADVVLENDKAILYDTAADTLLYYTGSDFTRSIKNQSGDPQMSYLFKKTTSLNFVLGEANNITLPLDGNEQLPYGEQTNLSRADKRELLLTYTSASKNVNSGKQALTKPTTTSFTTTTPSTYFNVGEKINFPGNSKNYLISSISGSTITVSDVLPTTVTGGDIWKVYKTGDIIDLTTNSEEGAERTVSTTNKRITINLKSQSLGSFTGSLTYPVSVSGAIQAQKTLRSNCFVKISLAAAPYFNGAVSNTAGPFSLGIPDVFNIRSIRRRDDGTFPSGTSDGSDAINQFSLDNGQRDSFYDVASIKPKVQNLSTSTRLLVNFDYFEPSYGTGKGYFTVDSYPIDDSADYDPNTDIQTAQIPVFISPISKNRYNLRNYVDFRPYKTATASYSISPSSADTNPAISSGFNYISGSTSLRFPAPSTQFSFSFSYYLARKDLIIMDKDGNIIIEKGKVPSLKPVTPDVPPGTMAVASLFVAPYPSLAPAYAQFLNRADLGCYAKSLLNIRYTMRDIGVLKNRIVSLEYYASLNALQKDASDMAVLDENGLNRFKNGIFVNDFTSHQFGDIRNEDYRIVVDPDEKCIRPFFTTESFYYDFLEDDPDTNDVVLTNDFITLPYTETSFLEWNVVTQGINVERSSYRFQGNLYLDPELDVWVDTEIIPDTQIKIGPDGNNLPQPVTTWNNWQKTITGYYVEPQGPKVRSSDKDQWVYGGYFSTVPNLISSPNSPRDQRVTQFYDESRTGTYTTYSYSENSVQIGDRIVDTALQSYIRGQVIDINGRGLKGNTRVYLFFDGERLDQNCAPMTVNEYVQTPEQRSQKITGRPGDGFVFPQVVGFEPPYYKWLRAWIAEKYGAGWRTDYPGYPSQMPPDLCIYPPQFGPDDQAAIPRPPTCVKFEDVYDEDKYGKWPPIPPEPFVPKYGDPLYTDENGEIYLCLNLPNNGSKQFTVGQKEVVLTDSINNSEFATTYAKSYFYAQGLTQYKQGTILTTRSIVSNTVPRSEKKSGKTVVGYINNPSCTAYSFVVKTPEGEEGLFITSVDVWYQRKHPTLGIWFEIREMDNAGNITKVQVPMSETWLKSSEVIVSETYDDRTFTRVQFRAPIFLYSEKEYAFVMHTEGLNPDYYVWVSQLTQNDVRTANVHSARPLTGTYYTTNNNTDWDMVPDLDLRVRFNRAKFSTITGTAVLGNRGTDRLLIDPYARLDANINSDLKLISPPTVDQVIAPPITIRYGENFVNQQVTFRSNSGYFKNGDSIMCTTTMNTYTILSVRKSSSSCSSDNCDYTKISIANGRIECTNGYFKLLYGSNSITQRIGSTSQSLKHDMSKLKVVIAKCKKHKHHHYHHHRGKHCSCDSQTWVSFTNTGPTWVQTGIDLEVTNYVRVSTGKTIQVGEIYTGKYKFKAGEYMVSSETNTAAYIIGVQDFRYSLVDFEPSYLTFKNTSVTFEMKPTSNGSPGMAQGWHPIVPGRNYQYDTEMSVYSRTNEYLWFNSEKTNKVKVTLSSASEYVSPIVDVTRCHSVYVDNILSANTEAVGNVWVDYAEECEPSGGEIANKYISIPITLAEGQDAEDLLVMLTAYRPPDTDVIVFAKFLNGEDSDTLAQRLWIPLEKYAQSYSSFSSRDDFKEFSYRIPDSYMTGPATDNSPGGEFQYYNSQGIKFTGFKVFQIKIALTGTNTAYVPKVADLRCIALQI